MLLHLFIQKAFAQGQQLGIPIPGTACNTTNPVTLPTYIGCIYEFATYLAVGLAIIMIIYGGYKYITSQGNPDAVGEAKDIIGGAIIGLLVLGLAYLILLNIGGGIVQTPTTPTPTPTPTPVEVE